jgi:RNA polymerase sigma-70 factor, ECF subfamily
MARWAPPEIVGAAYSGDAGAAEQLVATIWVPCFRLAATVIGDPGLAEDAAQEACAIVHRKVRSLRHIEAFDAWLYRIVMRESNRVRRRREVVAEAPERSNAGDDTTSIDVWQALATLSPRMRDVTVLFYFDDLKSNEIAAILRIPHATVRTRLARARERLRDLLGEYGDGSLVTDSEAKQHAF